MKLALALEGSNHESILGYWIVEFTGNKGLGIRLLQKLMDVLAIEYVILASAFPSNDIVSFSLLIIEFDHEFELEHLLLAKGGYLRVRYIGNPVVALCPFHLHASFSTI